MNAGSQNSSSPSKALWVIASALSIIAACLLLFLVQEQFRSKQTDEQPSPGATPQAIAEDLSKPPPKVPSRPLTRTIRPKPVVTASIPVVETVSADSSPANAEPIAGLALGAAITPRPGGYAP